MQDTKLPLSVILNSVTIGVALFRSVRNAEDEIVDFEYLYLNPAALDIIDHQHKYGKALIGKWLCAVFPGVRKTTFDDYVRTVETGKPFETEIHYTHEHFDHWFHQVATKAEDGFVLTFSDITQQKKAEQEFRQSVKVFENVFKNSAIGIASVNTNGQLVRSNNFLHKLLGYSDEEMDGKPFSSFTLPEDHEPDQQLFEDLLSGKASSLELEKSLLSKEGQVVWCRIWASLIRDEDENPQQIIAIVQDITASMEARHQVDEMNASLEKRVAERTAQLKESNQELQEFSYSVSHDLRAPLRAIAGYSNVLKEDYYGKFDKEGKEVIDFILYNTSKMYKLIDDLLGFSRLSRMEKRVDRLEMQSIIDEILHEAERIYPDQKVEITMDPLPDGFGDRSMLTRLWQNLIFNAIKFSGKQEVSRLHFSGWENEAETGYAIKDNGAGFKMDYADKIFGVFERLHSEAEFEGTGVGLALCKRILGRHGGRIWAESELGKGAAFYFTLPKKPQS